MDFPLPLIPASRMRPALIPGGLVERPGLMKRLGGTENNQITVVTGPAGYGKTTAVASWLAMEKIEARWLNLNENVDDAATFWRYMYHIAGLKENFISETVQTVSAMEMAAILLSELESRDSPAMMILDDYQLISRKEIHESLRYFLFHLPGSLRIIIVSRIEPPLGLGKLRMSGRLLEIRIDDLAFTEEETESLLIDYLSTDTARAISGELCRSTEGWAAAIRLAAMAIKISGDIGVISRLGGTNRYIADYLVEEVLSGLGGSEYLVLLEMSVPDSFSLSMLKSVTGRDEAPELAESFRKNNYFLVESGEKDDQYRFHPFFRQFLLHRLKLENPSREKELNGALCRYHLNKGNLEEALEYAFRCRDLRMIDELLEPVAARLSASRRLFRFDKWLAGMPELNEKKYPSVLLFKIRTHLQKGEVEQVAAHMKGLEEYLSPPGNPDGKSLRISLLMFKATLSLYRCDFKSLRDFCREALDLMEGGINRLKSLALSYEAIALFYSGENTALDAAECLHKAYGEGVKSADWIIALNASFQKAVFLRFAGDFYNSEKELTIIEERIGELALPLRGISGTVLCERAVILCEKGFYEESLSLADRGLESSNESCSSSSIWWSQFSRASVLFNTGLYSEAASVLEKLDKNGLERNVPPWFSVLARSLELKNRMEMGESPETGEDFRRFGYDACQDPDPLILPLHLAYARSLMNQGRKTEAEKQLRLILGKSRSWRMRHLELESSLLLAVISGGEFSGNVVEDAFRSGYFNTISREGKKILPLLERQNIRDDKFRQYINKLKSSVITRSKEREKGRHTFELTEREREVLFLMGKGYSNSEISEELFISLNTTKTHLKNINSKLGAENRTRAVFIGRENELC